MINQETRPIFQDSEMTNFISVILIRIASLIGIVVNIINNFIIKRIKLTLISLIFVIGLNIRKIFIR